MKEKEKEIQALVQQQTSWKFYYLEHCDAVESEDDDDDLSVWNTTLMNTTTTTIK